MKWSEAHDVHFLKEMTLYQPWLHKKGTTERGEIWANLATCLGAYTELTFRVTQRSIRDRYLLLERRYKKKIAEEEKASGISPEPTELDHLMEDIVTLFEEADKSEAEKKENLKKKLLKFKKLEECPWKHLKKQKKETQMKNQKRNREQVVLML